MSEKTLLDDHFRRPRNAGMLPEPRGQVKVENPVCGDELFLYWRLAEEESGAESERRIGEVRFQVYGCPAAIAAGSILTEMLGGAEPSRLAEIDADEISSALGGLNSRSYHAAVLAADGLRALLDRLLTADQ